MCELFPRIEKRFVITVCRYTRGFLARRRFLNISRSTVLIQAVYRGYRERKQFNAMKKGALMAQKLYRGKKQRERFTVLKEEMAKRAEIERASKERAKAKQQREEHERTSRAVAGVNHLEIPAELAFIYSKLDGTFLSNRQTIFSNVNLFESIYLFYFRHLSNFCIFYRLATYTYRAKSSQGRWSSHPNELHLQSAA